jgi:hypothetical protein
MLDPCPRRRSSCSRKGGQRKRVGLPAVAALGEGKTWDILLFFFPPAVAAMESARRVPAFFQPPRSVAVEYPSHRRGRCALPVPGARTRTWAVRHVKLHRFWALFKVGAGKSSPSKLVGRCQLRAWSNWTRQGCSGP